METTLKLVFAGGSTYSEDYVEKLKRYQSERILFLGFQTGRTLQELFSNAYLFVLPSRIEGLSISLLEAMGYGSCVLTSDIPENLELVKGLGFTFRTGNIDHLRSMLQYLIRHPKLVEKSGRASRLFIKRHYTWDVIALMTSQFYERLVEGRNGFRSHGQG